MRSPDPIYAERVRATYAQLPLTLAVTVVNVALVAIVLSPFTSVLRLWCWVGAILSLAGGRLIGWSCYRRSAPHLAQDPLWARLGTAGSFLSGSLWGFCAVFLFPPTDVTQLFLALVIAGMCAGAATVHATHIPTVVAFVLPATLPLAGRFLDEGGTLQIVSGIMTLIFGVAMCMASFRFQSWFIDTFSTQFRLEQRTRELDVTNARLMDEISSRLATEQRLQQSQKLEAIGRLTAGIAHDFNNLLMVVSGIAERIDRRLGPSSPHRDDLAAVLQATQRGAALTRQLLAFGRRQPLAPRLTNLNSVLTGMEKLLQTALAGTADLEMHLDLHPELVLVDPQQIEQAILNLVTNARDAMPDGGRVTITTEVEEVAAGQATPDLPPGRYAVLAVADTGVGMQEDVRVRAIEPFFTTKEVGKGSGFGLSQVHGLVHQSGGTMTIDSLHGRGTTVRLYLPVERTSSAHGRLSLLSASPQSS